TPPWYVKDAHFDTEKGQLDVYIDFKPGSTFDCPICEETGRKALDTKEKTWRHLNFFQHTTYLHARVPRVCCSHDKSVHQVNVPWSRPGSGFTLLFEAYILTLVEQMPVRAAARVVGEQDTRLWRILHHYVDKARENEDLSSVTRVAVDETSQAKGHNYVTLFVDTDRSRVIYVTEGKGAGTLEDFTADFRMHGGSPEAITDICMDMSPAFIAGAETHLPHAAITFDKFHAVKLVNEAVDQVRRAEQRTMPALKGTRYVWLKNASNLTVKQKAVMDDVLKDRHLQTVRAYHFRLSFQEMYRQLPLDASMYLQKWYYWATHSRLQPIIQVAKTIKKHRNGILRWFESRITNGLMEGINSLVQAAKNKARGYRSSRNLITIIYLIAGKLNLQPV
ncbi:ISL3 family transposase, partial [Heliophilum fasciatum]